MCTQGMEWDLLYILQMSKLRTFQELATKAHDKEMTIASCRNKSSSSSDSRKDKGEFNKNLKSSKSSSKEFMVVSSGEPIRISGKPKYENKKSGFSKDTGKKRPTLKELQKKKYPFPGSDLLGMLDNLLENGVIKLPQSKRPEETGRVTDLKYYRYHRVISHSLEKYITLKERIMKLARDGKIILDLDDTVGTNHISTQLECSSSLWKRKHVRPHG